MPVEHLTVWCTGSLEQTRHFGDPKGFLWSVTSQTRRRRRKSSRPEEPWCRYVAAIAGNYVGRIETSSNRKYKCVLKTN